MNQFANANGGDERDRALERRRLLAMIAVAMLKMHFWMEMNKNVTLREIKRLELQVARPATRA